MKCEDNDPKVITDHWSPIRPVTLHSLAVVCVCHILSRICHWIVLDTVGLIICPVSLDSDVCINSDDNDDDDEEEDDDIVFCRSGKVKRRHNEAASPLRKMRQKGNEEKSISNRRRRGRRRRALPILERRSKKLKIGRDMNDAVAVVEITVLNTSSDMRLWPAGCWLLFAPN